jgi:hypothetical protein
MGEVGRAEAPDHLAERRAFPHLAMAGLGPREDGRFEERTAPAALTSGHVTIPDVYVSLLQAGSRTLRARLPDLAPRPVSRKTMINDQVSASAATGAEPQR